MNNYDNEDLYQGQGHVKHSINNNSTNNNNNNDGRTSARNSGGNVGNNNTSQPRSHSGGLPYFSLRSRKSAQRRRHEAERVSDDKQMILDISSPIVESKVTTGAGNYSRDPSYGSLSTEQPTPTRTTTTTHNGSLPRQSLEANQFQQQTNAYVAPPKPNAGAYKAPVPSLPISAQFSSTNLPLTRMSLDSPLSYPLPPGSSSSAMTSPSNQQQQQHDLLRSSLRNASAAAVTDGRKSNGNSEPTHGNGGLSRSESLRSQTSRASSTFSSGLRKKYRKPVSGSTFVTPLSPTPSSDSHSSFKKYGRRSSKTNSVHPEGSATIATADSSSRLNGNHVRLYLPSQQESPSENASTLSLPGSRYRGDNHSPAADDESTGRASPHTGRHASEISLAGSPVSGLATGANTPSLVGVNAPNNCNNSQFSSPRHSAASSLHPKCISSPLASPVHLDVAGTVTSTVAATTAGEPKSFGDIPVSPIRNPAHILSTRSSARESVSSVSTANYHWMDDQDVDSGVQDAINRDSVLMLFPSPTASDLGSKGTTTPAMTPTTATTISPPVPSRPPPMDADPIFNLEQMAQQSLEQQAQQHALLKYFFKGNYHAPLNKEELGSVLDVGCGAGLWMRDMAIEFPLTEIHGVDVVVPTRKRRPRVTPLTTSTTPKTGSPTTATSTPFASKHSSVQNSVNGSSSSLVGNTSLRVPPAMLDSMPSNCFFHKADAIQGLPFSDNTFDFCRVRLVLWGYNLNSFPDLLSELVRVTKKGGWIEFVDMDPCIKKANETGTRINEWIKTGLIHGNMDPDLVRALPKFLREYCDATIDAAIAETHPDTQRDSQYKSGSLILPTEPYGLSQLSVSKISLPFGPWGGKVGEFWQQCFTTFLHELEPMIMDATLSGLVMDQYHRQFQQEMQQRFAEAAAASEGSEANGGGGGDDPSNQERVTSFDQRLCTHLAWSNLIDQLAKDATLSSVSLTNPATKATPYSHANFLSSIKEVRSYNNFYIAYAQKVDILELKQQYILSQLEQEISSPNPGIASLSTFPSLGAAAAYNRAYNNLQKQDGASVAAVRKTQDDDDDGIDGPVDGQSDISHMANTLIQKLSSPNLHQRCVTSAAPGSMSPRIPAAAEGEDEDVEEDDDGLTEPTTRELNQHGLVTFLTHDALETFNRTQQDPTTAVASTSTPPTPTSVAALSIRSSSRNSHRNNSITGSITSAVAAPAVGTPGSITSASGGPHSPRVGYGALRRQESGSGLSSPQAPASAPAQSTMTVEEQQQDYFNHMPIEDPAPHPSVYQQQQMNTVKRKPSLLSNVVTPTATTASTEDPGSVAATEVATAAVAGAATAIGVASAQGTAPADTIIAHSEEDEGDEGPIPQKQIEAEEDPGGSDTAVVDVVDEAVDLDSDYDDDDGDESSEILIALQDDDPEEEGEDTIEIINQVLHHGPDTGNPFTKSTKDEDGDVGSEEGPLGHLTPFEDGDDSEDDGEHYDNDDDDEVVFVMMAPPGPSVPDPGSDPGPGSIPERPVTDTAGVLVTAGRPNRRPKFDPGHDPEKPIIDAAATSSSVLEPERPVVDAAAAANSVSSFSDFEKAVVDAASVPLSEESAVDAAGVPVPEMSVVEVAASDTVPERPAVEPGGVAILPGDESSSSVL
ncbi:hypothetical protein BGX33_001262 [Mortierella sp. NVP41]|nr:hypothetical protein BGX33_001262 [Mortierella sp. NVP41]